MVTSRTGTAKYMRNRRKVLDQARRDGIVNCPGYVDAAGVQHPCGRELNYDVPRLPESVEADHILAPKFGGTDAVVQDMQHRQGRRIQDSGPDAQCQRLPSEPGLVRGHDPWGVTLCTGCVRSPRHSEIVSVAARCVAGGGHDASAQVRFLW
jgi:hypothetical protein